MRENVPKDCDWIDASTLSWYPRAHEVIPEFSSVLLKKGLCCRIPWGTFANDMTAEEFVSKICLEFAGNGRLQL